MKKDDVRAPQGNNSDVRRKEKENRQLQLQLRTEKDKLNSTIIKYQREIDEMQAVSDIKYMHLKEKGPPGNLPTILHEYINMLFCLQSIAEESQVRLEMQMSLDSKDSDIERLRCQITSLSIRSLDTTSISSTGNDLEGDDTYPGNFQVMTHQAQDRLMW